MLDAAEDLENYKESLSDFLVGNQVLLRSILAGEEISALDFLFLCDERIYNTDNKQNDIKYMKRLDFAGLYYIKNITKKKCYVGRGDKVFKKVERHFKGYENQEIFNDFEKNDKFVVAFIKYEEDSNDSFEEFVVEKMEQLQQKLEGYQYFGIKISRSKKHKSGINDQEIDTEEIENPSEILEDSKFWKKRVKAFIFHRKKIFMNYMPQELTGNYVMVLNKLKENGFNNIEVIPLKDIYIDSIYRAGEVDSVTINEESVYAQGDMIPYDAKIKILYHSKRELIFPYSSRFVKKKNCDELLEKLRDIGFTEIELIPIKDLIKGWIVKNNSVEKMLVNQNENYKKGEIFNFDVPITMFYHTFR